MYDVSCLANLVLNVFDVRPTYVWSGLLSLVVAFALTHLSRDLQLHPLLRVLLLGSFIPRIALLRPSIVCLILSIQE